jgi:glycosyltransferase involved in cell wall biosynthesis
MKKLIVDARMIDSSGIGTYIENVLSRIINNKLNFKIILLGEKEKLAHKFPEVEIIECSSSIYGVKEQLDFIKKTPKEYDLFWSPHYNIPVFSKKKLLVTIHDFFHLDMPEFVQGFEKKLYARLMFNRVSKRASEIITVSNFSKKQSAVHLGKNNNVNVIYNGVDQKWFELEKDKNKEKSYILFVGNVKPHKNLKNLIKAYELVKNDIVEDLVIVGKKEGFITGDSYISSLNSDLLKRITFTGYVSDAELKDWVCNAKALVFPSIYEGFGLPPLEAMACGTPVITSDAASLPEVCKDASVYFDPYNIEDIAEKLKSTLNNEELLTLLSTKGKKQATKFTWEDSVNKHVEVIERLLK